MSSPWNCPARLSGLPVTNWKKRTGSEMHGSLAACVERWLGLPEHQQRDCYLSIEGVGHFEGRGISSLVMRYGLPPAIAVRVNMSAQQYLKMIEPKAYVPPPSADKPAPGHSTPVRGEGRG
jgi:hypothetical protein